MIIDYTQNKESVDISYVLENKQIGIENIQFDSEIIVALDGEKYCREYHNFISCLESDPNKHPFLRSFQDSPIKLEPSKYFTHHNVNYFLNYEIPKFYPEIYSKLNNLLIPNMFSVDIETDIDPITGYSNEEEAANSIRSISITDINLGTILFIVKDAEHTEIKPTDKGYIDNILQETLGHYFNQIGEWNVRFFDSEYELLTYFIECIRKYFHVIFGWNFLKFDWQYIFNRCDKLGISVKNASPTNKLTKHNIELANGMHKALSVPTHRMIIDYMTLFKESLIYSNLGKYNLDSIATLVLNLKKVTYTGNLHTLYTTDYLRFVGYALVDTIIVMLLHKTTNIIGVEFFNSYYTGIPFLKLSQNSISEALCYKELIIGKQFLLESEKSTKAERPYQGGYVKTPTKKIVGSVAGFDFGSLYPNTMITLGLSPEAFIDKISVGEDGWPNTDESRKIWNEYYKRGYCLVPNGVVLDVSKDYLFTRIEKKLLAERKIFRRYEDDLYLNIIPKLEQEINRRGLKQK